MLDRLFAPRSIAIIGATPKADKVGNTILRNLCAVRDSTRSVNETRSRIYAVNPKYTEVLGLQCYPSVSRIDERVDLAVVVVPASHVPEILEECGRSGITNVIVISAGFKEAGRDGAVLEAELVRISKRYGIQLVGPNSLGVINTHAGLNATFGKVMPMSGKIAFLTQSGAFALAVIDWAIQARMGLSKLVSLGNKTVLDESDFLEFLATDDETEVVTMYLEDIRDGRRFMKIARRISETKPVVVMKSGKTEAGTKAASSHTGSIAGSVEAYRTAFRQTGVIEANSISELFDFSLTLARIRLINGGIAVVTNSGGPGVMAADEIGRLGLQFAAFDRATIEHLRELDMANVYNPVDVRGDADSEKFGNALNIVAADNRVGAIIAILSPTAPIAFETAGEYLLKVNEHTPVIPVFMSADAIAATVERLKQHGITNYFDPVRAVEALYAVMKYSERRTEVSTVPPRFNVDRTAVERILALHERDETGMGLGSESFAVLEAYGIPVPPYGAAKTADEALAIADRIGYPVVMKVLSPDIMHKTDVGGVKLGVERDAVRETFFELVHRAERYTSARRIAGVLVQKKIEGGREVIIGLKRDAHFGPLLMFGLGGIYVEVFKDVSFGIAPLSDKDALAMIKAVKAYRILRGTRGEPPADIISLVDLLLRFSQLSTEFPAMLEADLNPVKVFAKGKGCCAIDFKLVTEGGKKRK
ncbi:MAG: acetate--CoA ligase family protein [Methanomicrobia archaeon]|nr:acetate--CoA ligase family protein [Methanomicrobia archaeon]